MTQRLRVAFMGSPDFAVPSLEALLLRSEVCRVVTQPDQPAGRGRQLTPTAVKQIALRHHLFVDQPVSVRRPPYAPVLAALDLDLICVVAYGKILPPELLAVPRYGCWNVHASLLPRHRGAAPIAWSILAGDRLTGVTLMQMEEGLDSGPILLQRQLAVEDDDTAGSLHDRLACLGAELLADGFERLRAGTLAARPQNASLATLAPRLEKADGRVDWQRPAEEVSRRIRAMDPWPGAFTTLGGELLKLWRPSLVAGEASAPPGVVLGADARGLMVACGAGAIALGELQLPGRRRLPAAALLAGHAISTGTVLGR